jgi:hypothetical protein
VAIYRPFVEGSMKIVLLAVVALAGCAAPSVVPLGDDRYRVTMENVNYAGEAERAVAEAAQQTCATRGKRADIQFAYSRPQSGFVGASASADVTCR